MKKFVKPIRNTLFVIVGVMGAIYGLNAVILYLATPSNVHEEQLSNDVAEYGTFKIVSYDSLNSGSISVLGWNSQSSGYVNMLSSENVIYVDSKFKNAISQTTYFYKHESSHIYQKEMIAKKAGGYPSMFNPYQSAKYYYYMIQLNSMLDKSFPDTKDHTKAWFMTEGFEASADCFAQPYDSEEYKPIYLDKGCSDHERRLAISLISTDKWFDPNRTFENPRKGFSLRSQ